MKNPPVWSTGDLKAASEKSEEHFREGRHTEPLELYLELFDEYQGIVEEFLGDCNPVARDTAHQLASGAWKTRPGISLSGAPCAPPELP